MGLEERKLESLGLLKKLSVVEKLCKTCVETFYSYLNLPICSRSIFWLYRKIIKPRVSLPYANCYNISYLKVITQTITPRNCQRQMGLHP